MSLILKIIFSQKRENELHNRDLHISGLLDSQKVDIGSQEVDIDRQKADIENILSQKGKGFLAKTRIHVYRLFEQFGYDKVFGRSNVTELLGLKPSAASKFISNLVRADIIESVTGYGKGKYRFKKADAKNK